jgi:hypothetical protein
MSAPIPADRLVDRTPVSVVLRLLLDKQGRLVHGESLEGTSGSISRFSNWEELISAVQAVIAHHRQGNDP